MTGVEGFIDVPASNCFATNAWRCQWSLEDLPLPLLSFLLRLFLGPSGRILVSRGKCGWLAMLAFQHLGK